MKENNKNNRIEELMNGAIRNIRSLIDVDVVIGSPIETVSNLTIIPLTKVTMGFVSGGGEYYSELREIKKDNEYPFAGGAGSGSSVQPIGFLVIDGKCVEIVKIEMKSAVEKLIEAVPEVAKFISKNFCKDKNCEE
ncbi:MAG: GerW family sporulation protein [Clostridia bacterium]|nr:GerW family sporulation protein [Clostridia bacterium]